MPQIRKSILVPHSASRMYELVADVPSYPDFMPWCAGARAVTERDGRVRATVEINYKGIRSAFTTLNHNRRPEAIDMEFADGPFSALTGGWQFFRLDESACKIAFSLKYEFSSTVLGRMIAPVFNGIAASFIEAFSSRAESIYGKND